VDVNAKSEAPDKTTKNSPDSFEAYTATFDPHVSSILRKIRATIRKAAPKAQERISYRMPAFKLNRDIAYFAAFKNHIGFYPPVRGDEALEKAAARYAGPKGNLQFPLDKPIPYALIARIVKQRVKLDLAIAKATKARKRPSRKAD
jgi:uncharacterized protein YdhG (YjbR/CyaY superfamily)